MKKYLYITIILVGIIFCISFYQNPYKISENFTLLKPSFQHILGTDNLGRDIFSRLLLGTFYSIFIAFSAILLAGIVGSLLGAVAGYFGGYIDEFFLFISEIFMSIPVILITLGIIVLLNNGFHSIILALFVLYMPRTLSYVRGLVKREKHKNYIKIAKIY